MRWQHVGLKQCRADACQHRPRTAIPRTHALRWHVLARISLQLCPRTHPVARMSLQECCRTGVCCHTHVLASTPSNSCPRNHSSHPCPRKHALASTLSHACPRTHALASMSSHACPRKHVLAWMPSHACPRKKLQCCPTPSFSCRPKATAPAELKFHDRIHLIERCPRMGRFMFLACFLATLEPLQRASKLCRYNGQGIFFVASDLFRASLPQATTPAQN